MGHHYLEGTDKPEPMPPPSVVIVDPVWNFCRIENQRTGKVKEVYLERFRRRGTLIRWKRDNWKILSSRKTSPVPFLSW